MADTSGIKRSVFATTHWSEVQRLQDSNPDIASKALEELCRCYWFPAYGFLRRQGHSPEDAKDLCQSFFLKVIEKKFFEMADASRGRFRSFLLTALKHFVSNEIRKGKALRRGGGNAVIPLDIQEGESRLSPASGNPDPPDLLYERDWAITLLDSVMDDLRSHYRKRGEEPMFNALKPSLIRDPKHLSYAETGRQLGLSEGAVKVAVHRMRQRYRRLLKERIAQTVVGEEEVEDELHHLFRVLNRTQ